MIKIQSIYGRTLFEGDFEELKTALEAAAKARAYLGGADLGGAYLRGAYLRGADLRGAYLGGADLGGAYLRGADLRGANLSGADLSGAKNFNSWRTDSLRILLDQPGAIRAYKLVTSECRSLMMHGGPGKPLDYSVGNTLEIEASADEAVQCAAGISLGDFAFVARAWSAGNRIMIAEFTAADIAAIPYGTDGKFRVRKCRIVGEVDLVERGLVEKTT